MLMIIFVLRTIIKSNILNEKNGNSSKIIVPNNSNIGRRKSDQNNEIIGLHNDSEFGHPEEEINFVLNFLENLNQQAKSVQMSQNSIKRCKRNIWGVCIHSPQKNPKRLSAWKCRCQAVSNVSAAKHMNI